MFSFVDSYNFSIPMWAIPCVAKNVMPAGAERQRNFLDFKSRLDQIIKNNNADFGIFYWPENINEEKRILETNTLEKIRGFTIRVSWKLYKKECNHVIGLRHNEFVYSQEIDFYELDVKFKYCLNCGKPNKELINETNN